jgi:hypothetical protein
MGYDFNTWLETVIEYKDPSVAPHVVQDPVKSNHICFPERDASGTHAVDRKIREYGTRTLYENGTWNESPISVSDIDAVSRITVRMNGWTLYKQ